MAIAQNPNSSSSRLAVPFTDVQVDDAFWAPRLDINRRVTIPYCFQKCEETGRISNFAKAGGLVAGKFEGIYYNDSDVYKVIEGAAYSLAGGPHPDPQLDAYLDGVIAKIAAAQQPDGYLNTYHTLGGGAQQQKRWTNLRDLHELYCAGHLLEAAVAHHQATGKRTLLEVAIRLADHIDSVFGPEPHKKKDPCGHEEIEIGLFKLHRDTGDPRYLKLAKFFIDQRGNPSRTALYGAYAQDHIPVVDQTAPVGHAVRAMYLYCGMTDIAALAGDQPYAAALDRIWANLVQHKLYLTGGIGARHQGEAFGDDDELPNDTAYNETCAAIGNALWNHRMHLLHGDSASIDVLERILYNGFLSGISLGGDRFFYPNPLASRGSYHRSPWFDCSCCPVNIVRFVSSIPGFFYTHDDTSIDVNLFIAGTAKIKLPGNEVTLRQDTRYPWQGQIALSVDPQRDAEFDLNIRIPGWALRSPVPSDLYEFVDPPTPPALDDSPPFTLRVNGNPLPNITMRHGYASIHRTWKAGDRVELDLPMPVRLVRANDRVQADRGRVAITRGPIVYCLEANDNGGHVRDLWLPRDARFSIEHNAGLLGGVTIVKGKAMRRQVSTDGGAKDEPVEFTAIPYFAWDNRETGGAGKMAVWIPTDPELAQVIPPPTIAGASKVTASHCWATDSPGAVNDQLEPSSSGDESIPRLTWWDHRGSREWVQYDFASPQAVSAVEVYWFDDTGRGQCRLPQAWTLLYRDGDQWKPVGVASAFECKPDAFNRATFDPITTTGLRLEVQLREGFSGGILEWRVH